MSDPPKQSHRLRTVLRALDAHSESNGRIDARGVVRLVEPPSAPGLLRDGGRHLEVEFAEPSVLEAALHNGFVESLGGDGHAAVALRELDHHKAVVAL